MRKNLFSMAFHPGAGALERLRYCCAGASAHRPLLAAAQDEVNRRTDHRTITVTALARLT